MQNKLDRARELHRRGAAPALLAGLVLAGLVGSGGAGHVTATAASQAPEGADDPLLRWPLPPGAERYGTIDGRRMHRDVVAQAEIARRHRDEVNPQFWGRIIGTWSDAESAEWLKARFDEIGLADVRIQPLDLLPQWMPQSWEVEIAARGLTRRLESAQPFYRSAGTRADGLDLEAVYVGLGTEADFAGRDVRGKAVFAYSLLGAPATGAVRRAAEKGAEAVFDAHMLPGNMKYQAYPSGTDLPAFTIGGDDGDLVRELVTAVGDGPPPRVRIRLDVEMTPDLQTALVWGTLPGATDETVYVMAHRDGWFDAAGDNASGVASMIGLAEFYAAMPRADRPRTLVFLGLDGHHNSGDGSTAGGRWLVDHRDELFDKTALAINAEHPSTVQTQVRAPLSAARRDQLGQHLHAAAVVRGRTVTARAAGDRGARVQGVRGQHPARAERPAARRRPGAPVPLHAGGRDQRVLPLLPHRCRDRRRRCPGPDSRRPPAPMRGSSTR